MNTVDVMREYNEFECKLIHSFNGVKESDSNLTKFVSKDRHGSYISFFDFDESLSESIVKEQLAYFSQRKLCFEWKTYSTDKPSNIGNVLLANGFEQEDTESFMVLDLSKTDNKLFDESQITEVFDSQGIRDAIKVQEQVWGGSTIKEFRGNGYYSLLLNKRIAEAKSKGVKYLIIDASDMSKPIVSKRGFEVVATTTGYTSPNS